MCSTVRIFNSSALYSSALYCTLLRCNLVHYLHHVVFRCFLVYCIPPPYILLCFILFHFIEFSYVLFTLLYTYYIYFGCTVLYSSSGKYLLKIQQICYNFLYPLPLLPCIYFSFIFFPRRENMPRPPAYQ